MYALAIWLPVSDPAQDEIDVRARKTIVSSRGLTARIREIRVLSQNCVSAKAQPESPVLVSHPLIFRLLGLQDRLHLLHKY